MKKCLLVLFLFLVPCIVNAAEMNVSIPTGSQYVPKRAYGFQISCNDIENVTSAVFEWNGLTNYTPAKVGSTFSYNLTDLPAGEYSYRWFVNNASDYFVFTNTYSILKNSTLSISLSLNGFAGNKSYKVNTTATFLVSLPNKTTRLESNYPGWITQINATPFQYPMNLTSSGLFTVTASWDGDENYTGSSKTYYFDIGPPRFSIMFSTPESPVGYVPDTDYKLHVNVFDLNLTDVWFESNYTGTMKTYYDNSDPPLQNSSGTFWILLENLGVRNFSFRWHAKDILNDESTTEFVNYQILKMNPLVLELMPSAGIREGTQVTATCYSINPLEVPSSKFSFYKDSEPIGNISFSTRMGVFLMSQGTHDFTCSTNGTGNYTNQSIVRTMTVSSAPVVEEPTGELRIENIRFPSIKAGESGEASFVVSDLTPKNIFNLTVNITGIPTSWYSVTKPSSLYVEESKEVKINLSIPSDAEAKRYTVSIVVRGITTEGKVVSAYETSSFLVTTTVVNRPPTFYADYASTTTAGSDVLFSLEWSSDNGLSGYIFSTNNTGVWENDSWMSMGGGNGWFNVSSRLTSNSGAIAWKIYANDTNNEWSESNEYVVSVTPQAGSDFSMTLIIVSIIIFLCVTAFVFIRRMNKKEEIEYVYSKEDVEDEE